VLEQVGGEDAVSEAVLEGQVGGVGQHVPLGRLTDDLQLVERVVGRDAGRPDTPKRPGVDARAAAQVEHRLAGQRAVATVEIGDRLAGEHGVERLGVGLLVAEQRPQLADAGQAVFDGRFGPRCVGGLHGRAQ
jgi:hypothetical protein